MKSSIDSYDFIIAGMGAAGLSLAMQLKNSSVKFSRVLILDKQLKNTNDRTWCFWTRDTQAWYQEAVTRQWDCIEFKSDTFEKKFTISPYRYQLIRGIDFYSFCLQQLQVDSRFEIVTEEIKALRSDGAYGIVETVNSTYQASQVFNSAFRNAEVKKQHVNFVQHFKGWVITTEQDFFDDSCPIFMDFKTAQNNDCRFFYVIPFSKKKALIEYTGFSRSSIASEAYDAKIKEYIEKDLKLETYTVIETEIGQIPMMESPFVNPYGVRITNIGTAGGNSKSSTGYTFYFIQKQVQSIVDHLERGESLDTKKAKRHYKLYDKVLLDVMDKNRISSDILFATLFKKNKIENLLAFLNEESSIMQDLSVLNSVEKLPFLFSLITKLLN